MNLKYVENISAEKKAAIIRLYGRIGDDVDSSLFASEMRYLATTCNEITMRINSEGGSVLEGYTILDAMNEINEGGKCKVNTHNSGMAASMASVILCNGANRSADNYSVTMIHNAGGEDNNKVLSAINASIQAIYSTRTKLNADTATNLMSAETFMDASMAMEYGFIDNIVQTGRKVKLPKNKTVTALAAIYNELTIPKTMNKVTALLGLKNEASEEVVVESIETLQGENKALKEAKEKAEADLKESQDKLKAIEEAEAAKVEAAVVSKVENAITKGFAKAEKKDELIALGKINMSLLDTVIESNTKATKSANIGDVVNRLGTKPADDRSEWTIRDWEKKDPKGLTAIKNETPEVHATMYENYYKLGIGNKTFKPKG